MNSVNLFRFVSFQKKRGKRKVCLNFQNSHFKFGKLEWWQTNSESGLIFEMGDWKNWCKKPPWNTMTTVEKSSNMYFFKSLQQSLNWCKCCSNVRFKIQLILAEIDSRSISKIYTSIMYSMSSSLFQLWLVILHVIQAMLLGVRK